MDMVGSCRDEVEWRLGVMVNAGQMAGVYIKKGMGLVSWAFGLNLDQALCFFYLDLEYGHSLGSVWL